MAPPFARASRFMAILQIALLVISMVIMSTSVCHGAGIGGKCLGPKRFHSYLLYRRRRPRNKFLGISKIE